MKILDRYIIRNFLGTFLFATLLLLSISIVIDLSQRLHRLEAHHGSVKEALIYYYPVWALWLGNTFMPIGVFISIIFFTSRLANNTEIVAIAAGGISLRRLVRPYLMAAFLIFSVSFLLNHFILPVTNVVKNDFQYRYLISVEHKFNYERDRKVNAYLGDGEYVFIDNFSKSQQRGTGFVYQKFNGKKLFYIISAEQIRWDKLEKMYHVYNYKEHYIEKSKDIFKTGEELKVKIPLTPQELLPEEYAAETMDTLQLGKFIESERKKGILGINLLLNEYYQRTSLPFSTFILTLLAFSLSSEKRRGGIGANLALGIVLAFVYIFFMEVSKNFSTKVYMSSFLAVWLPNIIFGILSCFFYLRRSRY
ncbi:LptF/LptG family permease [Bacteroidetes bacterium endosymbiont of Geopemphigus sp.]|uniref:LptF/LptG family permease n=1 Tax=Bacteroidetes bacterium endosymbiont of Geopemphigus sp. TaxID=2047937 RepID=UPI000CD28799|nr:LptF/LptG family permease [Bacteroidetes bacterium endosymbiont of Geopemphigus sp.]